MSTFTAPEPGWYEPDASVPGGWRKLEGLQASALLEQGLDQIPDDRHLVWYARIGRGLVAWSAHHANQALPNGQVVPSRTATIVTFETEPFSA